MQRPAILYCYLTAINGDSDDIDYDGDDTDDVDEVVMANNNADDGWLLACYAPQTDTVGRSPASPLPPPPPHTHTPKGQ